MPAFEREPIDDDRDSFPVDPLVDVLQVRKILESGAKAKLLGGLHQPVRPDSAGRGTAGDHRQLFFRDFDAKKVQHHFQGCRSAISGVLSERSDVEHKTGRFRCIQVNIGASLHI